MDAIQASMNSLNALDEIVRAGGSSLVADRHLELSQMAPFSLSPLGEFVAQNANAYESHVANLLQKLVEPEPAPHIQTKKKSTPLLRSVKTALKAERILARKGEGLDTHRVVPNHIIAEGLTADLILKNGAMHIMQTADAFGDETPLRKAVSSIAISALVFEQARMTFSQDQVRANLIYQASTNLETALRPSLQAAEHQGAILINWDSRDDQRRFLANIAALAEPASSKRDTDRSAIYHSSTQQQFKIN